MAPACRPGAAKGAVFELRPGNGIDSQQDNTRQFSAQQRRIYSRMSRFDPLHCTCATCTPQHMKLPRSFRLIVPGTLECNTPRLSSSLLVNSCCHSISGWHLAAASLFPGDVFEPRTLHLTDGLVECFLVSIESPAERAFAPSHSRLCSVPVLTHVLRLPRRGLRAARVDF